MRPRDYVAAALAFLIPTLLLLPFATKAFHIDDTVYIRVAQHITEHPFDFYGFNMNWYGLTEPVYAFNKNPPGVSYFLAFVALFTGWDEIPLHAAMAVLTGLLSLGVYLLALRFCERPLLAALIAGLSPCVLVSGNTVMSDIPMVMYYTWGLFFWVKGVDEQRTGWLWLGAAAIAVSALHKYFGITAVGLAAVYAFAVHRRPGMWLLPLLLPVAVLAAYAAYAYGRYGIELFADAAAYAVTYSVEDEGLPWARKLYIALGFTGGLLITTLFFAPLIWRGRVLLAGLLLFLATAALLYWVEYIGYYPLKTRGRWNWPALWQSALFFLAGVNILAMLVAESWRRRSPASWLLAFWIGGVFAFSAFINWSITARTLLPLAPAAGILTARMLDVGRQRGVPLVPGKRAQMDARATGVAPVVTPRRELRYWLALAPGALVALAVVWGDFWLANANRTAAFYFARDSRAYSGDYYFHGHWGFQYYMDEYGLHHYETEGIELRIGDRIVVPQNNTQTPAFDRRVARAFVDLRREVPASSWVTTMHPYRAAGFYTHFWGPLPYGFGFTPPEIYAVYELGNWGDL